MQPRRVLDGAPWQVVHTGGPTPPLWRAFDWRSSATTTSPRPTQALDARTCVVESTLALPFGGDGARVVARGSFEAEGPELAVTVSDVSIEAGGRTLRLPLGGTGATTLVYGGRDVRVLRGGSGGALAVQVRSGALE